MSNPFLTGLFGGWTMVQVAVGLFFIQAYWARRRESEYLVFALVCFSLAVTDVGLTLLSYITDLKFWPLAAALTNIGAFAATALNAHFVLTFVTVGRARRFAVFAYVYSAAAAFAYLLDPWWEPGSAHPVYRELWGFPFGQMLATPRPIALLIYSGFILCDILALVALYIAFAHGKRRELGGAVIGATILILSASFDVANAIGGRSVPPMFPYAFLLYGFGVADTLIVRYRNAAGELEVTANELRHATEELTNSYVELSVVQEELFRKRQLASVGELAGSIAHEVRNPLAIIRNAASSLKRPVLGPEDKGTLFGIIEEEITRLNNLVAELLRYARPVDVHRETVALSEVLKAVAEQAHAPQRIEVHVPNDPDLETVWADANLLRLALSNVVQNALQASSADGLVTITASSDIVHGAPGVKIQIADQGHGMDEETRRRAGDPFFSTRPSGTGLGLPIASRIAEAHGGDIAVESSPGDGTTVTVRIPTKRAERLSEPRISAESRPYPGVQNRP